MTLKSRAQAHPGPFHQPAGTDPQRSAKLARLNYFNGRLLSASDLTREQDYHLHARWRHNRLLHGQGIVTGLQVSVGDAAGGSTVTIQPGFAIDPLGREVVLGEPVSGNLPATGAVLILVRYLEQASGSMPTPAGHGDPADSAMPDLIEEGAEVLLEAEGASTEQSGEGTAGSEGGAGNAVPLARLYHSRGKWRLDHHFRVPRSS